MKKLFMVAAVAIVCVAFAAACGASSQTSSDEHGGACGPAAEPNEPQKQIEQTTCPVMGGAINKEIFTEYKGKKVYFCCAACKPEFEKNPEKYISKLPQFKEEQ